MYEKKVRLVNEVGLDARPASAFIREAVSHSSDISIEKDGRSYNGKSIMSILSMNAGKDDELLIRAEGEDEEEAVESLIDLLTNKIADIK